MKFSIKASELFNLVHKVTSISEGKTTDLSFHNNLKISVVNQGGTSLLLIEMYTRNSAIRVLHKLECESISGVLGVQTKALKDFVDRINKELNLVFTLKDNMLNVFFGIGNVSFSANTEDAFPPFPDVSGAPETLTLSSTFFKDLGYAYPFRASDNSDRQHLRGVRFTEGKLIATTGFQIAIKECESIKTLQSEFTLPNLHNLKKCFDPSLDVVMSFLGSAVSFSQPGVQLINTVLTGKYPNWKVFLLTSPFVLLTSKTSEIKSALSLLSPFVAKKTPIVKALFQKDLITLSTSSGTNSGSVRIPCQYSGPEVLTGFNVDYLSEAIDCISSDDVTMEVRDAMSQLVVREPSYENRIMPARV